MKRLQDAGADERLAEAVVATLGAAVSEHVATKTDLEKLELRMTNKLYAAVVVGVGLIDQGPRFSDRVEPVTKECGATRRAMTMRIRE